MGSLILRAKIAALKTARAAIIASLSKEEKEIYDAILRQKLIDKGINYV